MRGEDKLVDGRDLKRREEDQRSQDESLAWRGNERFELGYEQELAELPARETTQHRDLDHRGLVLGAMRAIMEGQKVVVALLRLEPRELQALEALQSAIRAKDTHLEQFVYATDRRDLLEQALGVLQPTLMLGDPRAHELDGDLAAVTHLVAQLRITLIAKEDAQDELIVEGDDVIQAKPADDKDDGGGGGESEPEPELADDAAPKRSTLGHEDAEPDEKKPRAKR